MTEVLPIAFDIDDGSIWHGGRAVLSSITVSIPRGRVTALLGPSAGGKSLVLRALSDNAMPNGYTLNGNWRRQGEVSDDVSYLAPQWPVRRGTLGQTSAESSLRNSLLARVHIALAQGPDIILLDNPTLNGTEEDVRGFIESVRSRRSGQTVLMVTHNIAVAQAIADHVCFFVAGQMQAFCTAKEFFSHPPSELAQRFVRWGNCWPAPTLPKLPSHFHWLLPGRLAGMGRPGLLNEVEEDLTAIALAGVQVLVSLEESPFSAVQLQAFGIQARHLPIRDMGIPRVATAARMCRDIERAIQTGTAVAIHCKAGMGRTGTMLGAFLVWSGCTPERAIDTVRELAPGYIQNRQQERFLYDFAEGV